MKTKFTRGPLRSWGEHIFDSDGNPIGTVLNRNIVVQESNACLWAAAPEMYDQGEKSIQDFYTLARKLDYMQLNDMARTCEEYAENIKTILQKARGE